MKKIDPVQEAIAMRELFAERWRKEWEQKKETI